MKITEIVKEKLKEIEKSKKCKMCIQLNEDFGTDCPKHMKLKATLSGMQTAIKSELEFLKDLEGRWEPDGRKVAERITDLKNALKLIEEAK